jgi:hypothetical protein
LRPITTTRETAAGLRLPARFEKWWLIVGAVAIVLTLAVLPALRVGSFVHEVRIANPSEFDVKVDAASAPNDGWMAVGTARNHDTTAVQEVYDLGGDWYFRFSTPYGTAETHVSRSQLDQAGWAIEVPPSFVEQLRHAGAHANPRTGSG